MRHRSDLTLLGRATVIASRPGRAGFTVIEVLVAVVILTVGILAMMGSSAAVDRLITRGRRVTQAALLGAQVLDSLRRQANDDPAPCTGLASNSIGYAQQAVTVSWNVGELMPNAAVSVRQVQVYLTYRADRRVLVDTITTLFRCDA